MVGEFELKPGKKEKNERKQEKHAAGRSKLAHHGPKQLPSDAERALPGGKAVYLVPVDILAVEAIARAGVGGKLRPEVVEIAAFTDAVPEGTEAGFGSRRSGRAHA